MKFPPVLVARYDTQTIVYVNGRVVLWAAEEPPADIEDMFYALGLALGMEDGPLEVVLPLDFMERLPEGHESGAAAEHGPGHWDPADVAAWIADNLKPATPEDEG